MALAEQELDALELDRFTAAADSRKRSFAKSSVAASFFAAARRIPR